MLDNRGNKGWSTKSDKPRSGRPKTGQRPRHVVAAWPEEWESIQRYIDLVRKEPATALKIILETRKEIEK